MLFCFGLPSELGQSPVLDVANPIVVPFHQALPLVYWMVVFPMPLKSILHCQTTFVLPLWNMPWTSQWRRNRPLVRRLFRLRRDVAPDFVLIVRVDLITLFMTRVSS